MFRKRYLSLAVACSLGLSAGCQCSCDRPGFFSRWFSRSEAAPCCDSSGGQVIYDGPALPDGGPMIGPTPPPGMSPLPTPTPIQPQAAAIPNGNGRLVPQSQPMPYTPPR
ncbi:hypothetical protein AYO44_03500 [Planctomycetaceae bacterium SCGC AG-212-F19]|nr:hypothetical protein AYO44_03500 [Planctomycetaceae bacterium SCGC AG-212-F19]